MGDTHCPLARSGKGGTTFPGLDEGYPLPRCGLGTTFPGLDGGYYLPSQWGTTFLGLNGRGYYLPRSGWGYYLPSLGVLVLPSQAWGTTFQGVQTSQVGVLPQGRGGTTFPGRGVLPPGGTTFSGGGNTSRWVVLPSQEVLSFQAGGSTLGGTTFPGGLLPPSRGAPPTGTHSVY